MAVQEPNRVPVEVYRIVPSETPTEADFLSLGALNPQRRPPSDPRLLDMWWGISVFDTLDRARSQARKKPYLGSHVAVLRLPTGARGLCGQGAARAITRSGATRVACWGTYWRPYPCRPVLHWLTAELSVGGMIFYELWDKASRNLIASYPTKEAALELASELLATDPQSAEHLVLEWGDDEDEEAGGCLAEGVQLARLAGTAQSRRLGPQRLAEG